MKILYIECNMGAAGDMLMSALSELHPNPDNFFKRLNSLNIPDVKIKPEKSSKCGIEGTHINVYVSGEEENEHIYKHHHGNSHHHKHHHHSGMHDIEHIISLLDLSEKVKQDVLSVYKLIAEAESHVHGCEIDNIHFHEVGTMDAVADIVGVCMLIDELAPEKIIVSPVHVGSGSVECAHGILPVPAPATAYILRNVPIYSSSIIGELCTPTGAALLKYFADEFAAMPMMKTSKIGYGMGTKDFDSANCLRAMLGESDDSENIIELCCNLDDITGEQIGYAFDLLLRAGALDVYTIPIGMKKSRPGIMFCCICKEKMREKMVQLIFKHTSTIGIREQIMKRHTLSRREVTIESQFGELRAKESFGFGIHKFKPEYKDLVEISEKNNVAISEIKWE